MKPIFITGTDTDCGKTYATTRLLDFFPGSKAIKPIASGCFEHDGQLLSADALEIKKHCSFNLDEINPWRFKDPISPHIAARRDGKQLSAAMIVAYCHNMAVDNELLFIEGAGGLFVPLNDEETWIDLLQVSSFPVIVVVGMKLGCINHALLTAHALASQHVECLGWIANCIDPDMNALEENIDTLSNKMNVPYLGRVGYAGGYQDFALQDVINQHLSFV